MVIRYSALNSRLLLPPSTRPVSGSRGPIERMSKPRMRVLAAQEQRFDDRQDTCVLAIRPDVFDLRAEAERHAAV